MFLAEETRFRRRIVIKVLAPDIAASLSAERFEREIGFAAQFQHPNIVPVITAGDVEGLPWYTMPYVDGDSLRARTTAGPVPLAEAVAILRDVSRALAYAHGRGVVHRDIKPENVLLTGGAAVVTDFGIAKALSASKTQAPGDTLTMVGTSLGTPAYMAPEQAAGDDVDHRADMYAWGVMAYELLGGAHPFAGKTTAQQLIAAHIAEVPRALGSSARDIPAALADLVMACLAKDPAQRPASADDILRRLDDLRMAVPAAEAISRRISLGAVLLLWAGSVAIVALIARVAMNVLGLPDWVFPGALAVAGLVLPALLWTWYAQRDAPSVSWTRPVRGGGIALGSFALVVAAFMILRALGIGPVGSLLAAGKLDESAQILVAEFNVPGADSTLGRVVAEAVKTTLGESKVVRLMPASAVSAALERMRRPSGTRVSVEVAREIAQREGIAAVLSGDIATLGGSYVLTVRLLAASGDELATAQETAKDANDLIPAIDRATRSLRARIGESLTTVRNATPLERATTSSLEALRAYTIGLEFNSAGNFSEAAAHAERAIALDSNFARAYASLANVLRNLGAQARRRDTLVARAYALRDRLPDLDRLRVMEAYYNQGRYANGAKALAVAESLVALDPIDRAHWMQLGQAQFRRAELVRAESSYRRAISLGPGRTLEHSNLASVLLYGRRWTSAESVMRAMQSAGTEFTPFLRAALVYGAYVRGHLDTASLLARDMASAPRADVSIRGRRALRALALIHGRLGEGRRLEDDIRSADAQLGNRQPSLMDSISRASEDIWLHANPTRASGRLAALLRVHPIEQVTPDERPYLPVAALSALAGNVTEAKRWLARFDGEVKDPDLLRQESRQRAHVFSLIAVLEQHWDEALRQVDLGSRDADGGPLLPEANEHFWRGYVLAAAGRTDEAIASFERFTATPDLNRLLNGDADLLPFTLEKLGGMYEAKGNVAKAIEHYSRFVELWKNADPALQPRVTDVRRRIERLRSTKRE